LELVIDYGNCTTSIGYSADQIEDFSYPDGSTLCHISFAITENYTGDVKFYYGLREFYQNNRLYVESRNDLQLLGNLDKVGERVQNFYFKFSVKIPVIYSSM
ncbi:hypothetical protein OSTOST_25466, partial [Ostertagia ostertagi]